MAGDKPLPFDVVSGADARESGLTSADLQGQYIRVTLSRPVPEGGEARIRIIKTYKDPKTYRRDGDTIVVDLDDTAEGGTGQLTVGRAVASVTAT